MRKATALAFATCGLLWALSVDAQEDRSPLIASARAESNYTAALDIYLRAAEPVGIDSLWAVSVFEIAQILRDVADVPASDTWLRWAVRHGPEWTIDPDWFAPSLVAAYRQAETAVASELGGIEVVFGSDAVETVWQWPTRFIVGSVGTVIFRSADPSVVLSASVASAPGPVAGNTPVTLPASTYDVSLSAEGHETARIHREVLPGVATVVTVTLAPVLSEERATEAGARLLQLRYVGVGGTGVQCTNALSVRDGLALGPLSAIASATRIDVLWQGRVFEDVEIIESDASVDVAVLRLRGDPRPEESPTTSLLPPYGWSVFRAGCGGGLETRRLRIPAGAGEGQEPIAAGPQPIGSVGAPVVDREGRVVGLVVGAGRVAPIGAVDELMASASAQIAGGGFPYRWVTAGVAAAAGATVYLLMSRSRSSTGGIVIVLPTS